MRQLAPHIVILLLLAVVAGTQCRAQTATELKVMPRAVPRQETTTPRINSPTRLAVDTKARPDAPLKMQRVPAIVENGDTFPHYRLRDVYLFPEMKFKNRREERFYWRTVRDVKRVLPLAHYIKDVIKETNDTLMRMPTKKERDRYMRHFERDLYRGNEARMKKLTYAQGKLLIRLVDRECEATSYELIKAYRGSFRAGFYQMFAKIFGADLKSEFGSRKEDKIIERIIIQVESGQL